MPETQNEALVTKMSVRGIGCKPTGGRPENDELANDLCIIVGRADGIKLGEDKNTGSVWAALTGSFRGTNIATGVSVRSGKLFLPSGIHEVVENMVRSLGDTGGSVRFAFKISSVKASNPIGYSYQATSLIPMEAESDELADLIAIAAPAAVAQIAAPAADAPVADAKKGKGK